MPIVVLSDGVTQLQVSDNPTPQELDDLKRADELSLSLTRNPQEGGGPMPKIPFSDERIEAGPEALRVAAKIVYDATLGIPVGIKRAMDAGFQGTVGLFSPETANKMREASDFNARTNPVVQAALKAEQFIQPRSAEGTRVANIVAMVAGGGLMGKVGTAFTPAMGAGIGLASGLASETVGSVSNPNKWQGDPADDEQVSKMLFGLGVGATAPYLTRGTQVLFGTTPHRERLTKILSQSGLRSKDIAETMQPGGPLERAQQVGIPLTTAQAIPRVNPLDAAQGAAAGDIAMALTRRKLAEQPQQSLDAVENWIGSSAIGQGQRRAPQELANQARASANAHFDSIGADASAAKDVAMLQQGATAQVAPSTAASFIQQAKDYAAAHPGTRAPKVVTAVEKALTNPEWLDFKKAMEKVKDPANRLPNPYPQFLGDEVQVRGALDSALASFGPNVVDTKQVSAELNKHAGYLRGLINDVIAPETPGVSAGKVAAEQVLRRADADKQSLVGGMRGDPNAPAPLTNSPSEIFKDVKRAPVVGQQGEITQLRQQLESGTQFGLGQAADSGRPAPLLNELLFPDSARTHFADVLDKASARGGARPSDTTATVLLEELGNFSRGKNARAAMTQEIVQNVGDSLGLSSVATAADKRRLSEIMDVIGHTVEREGAGGLDSSEIIRNLSSPWMRTLGGTSRLTLAKNPFKALYTKHETASAKWLDSLLNTNEGRAELMKMLDAPEKSIHRAALSNVLRELSTEPKKLEEAKAAQERKAR